MSLLMVSRKADGSVGKTTQSPLQTIQLDEQPPQPDEQPAQPDEQPAQPDEQPTQPDEQPVQFTSSENAKFLLKTAPFTPFMLFISFMVENAASKVHHEEHEGHEGTPARAPFLLKTAPFTPAPPSRSGNSPAFERWEPRHFTATSPDRDERTVLPSLPGLCSFGDAPPQH